MADSSRDEIESDILEHLARHPESEETLEGIAEWWLLERSIERLLPEVRAALARLVEDGFLETRGGVGRELRYRLAEERRDEVERRRAARPSEAG